MALLEATVVVDFVVIVVDFVAVIVDIVVVNVLLWPYSLFVITLYLVVVGVVTIKFEHKVRGGGLGASVFKICPV